MSKSLKTIQADALILEQKLIESGGEIDETLEKGLQINSKELAKKLDSYVMAIKNIKSKIKLDEDYIQEFQAQMKSKKKFIEFLNTSIKYVLLEKDTKEISGNIYRFKLSKTKPSLEIDEEKLPPEYFKEVIKVVPDKEKIQSDLEKGVNISGARYVESYSLRTYFKK